MRTIAELRLELREYGIEAALTEVEVTALAECGLCGAAPPDPCVYLPMDWPSHDHGRVGLPTHRSHGERRQLAYTRKLARLRRIPHRRRLPSPTTRGEITLAEANFERREHERLGRWLTRHAEVLIGASR